MEIIVQGKKIETTEIFDIQEVEHNKKRFLNREAGFIIYLIDKDPVIFKEDIPYESYPSDISEIKGKWRRLREEVYAKWQLDKNKLEEFKLK